MLNVISTAFVDDHPILLSGIVSLFTTNPAFRVLGTGACADDIMSIAERDRPDVLVVDLNMPGRVLEAISSLVRKKYATKILVFTAITSVDTAVAVLEAGAHGYALKGSSEEELICAIQAVHDGETYLTPSLAGSVIAGLRTVSARRAAQAALRLTNREEQVLRLLLKGKTNREIGEAMSLSDKTVKHYMGTLMQRLHVRNRIEVILTAQELGMAEPAGTNRQLN